MIPPPTVNEKAGEIPQVVISLVEPVVSSLIELAARALTCVNWVEISLGIVQFLAEVLAMLL